MKKNFLLIIALLLTCSVFADDFLSDSDFYIQGFNEAEYIYRNTEDSLKHYFKDSFKFDTNFRKFRFGMEFRAELPKYDSFKPEADLDKGDANVEWKSRYLEYETDGFYLRGGTGSAVFGTGMMLHLYNNTDLEEDYRLDGIIAKLSFDKFFNSEIQAVYGRIKSDKDDFKTEEKSGENERYDVAQGLDYTFKPLSGTEWKLGASGVLIRKLEADPVADVSDKYVYNRREILGGKTELTGEIYDFKAEYAELHQYDSTDEKFGHAFYANSNLYLGMFTLTGGYKNYKKFNDRYADLPTLNYSEKAIAAYGYYQYPGIDEEGYRGIIRFNPNFENEITADYSEAWSSNDKVKMSDTHIEYKREMSAATLTLEYDKVERIDESGVKNYGDNEESQKISVDTNIGEMPFLIKAKWKTKDKYYDGHKEYHYEPEFQTDLGIGKFDVSVLFTYNFSNKNNLTDQTAKIGVEVKTPIKEHSELKVFAGSEKGGIVCRNGVCKNQAPFEGVRVSITTRF